MNDKQFQANLRSRLKELDDTMARRAAYRKRCREMKRKEIMRATLKKMGSPHLWQENPLRFS